MHLNSVSLSESEAAHRLIMSSTDEKARNMPSRTVLISVGVIVLLLVVGGGYYISQKGASANAVEVDITITQNPNTNLDYYTPSVVTVTQGQTVTLVVYDDDDSNHGFSLPAFNVDFGSIPAGHTIRMSFVADKTGTSRSSPHPQTAAAAQQTAAPMSKTSTGLLR